MKIKPTLQEVNEIFSTGEFKIVPVSCELMSDMCTPIEVLRVLKNVSEHCYLLESVAAKETWGRYTFLGFEPKICVTCIGGKLTVDGREIRTDNPSAHIRKILDDYKSPRLADMPTFTGGLVGYFAYDYLSYSEPKLKLTLDDEENFKDADLMLFDKVLIVNVAAKNLEQNYKQAVAELERMKNLILHGQKSVEPPARLSSEITPLFDRETYCAMVERAKRYIREGEIFQVVLSNRLAAKFDGSLLNAYRVLRTINPSPYMFYFAGTDMEVAGASPETLVKLEDGILHTFPLAGTRPRGKNPADDKNLERELLADEKELAEHDMLVDLGRNEVEKLHAVEKYSHVMHIGSIVRGEIRDEFDALNAVEAVLPAGTLSGAPKIRACQIIGELEQNKRGIYGGAIGYIDFAGNLDTCIAIRIIYKKNGKIFVRAGAGIVADSVPEREFDESMNKARACLEALKIAEELEL